MADKPKVVSLRGAEIIPPGVPRPCIVKLAEEILDRARSGDLMGLSVVMYHSDDTFTYWHEGRLVSGTLGTMERLKHYMIRDLD